MVTLQFATLRTWCTRTVNILVNHPSDCAPELDLPEVCRPPSDRGLTLYIKEIYWLKIDAPVAPVIKI